MLCHGDQHQDGHFALPFVFGFGAGLLLALILRLSISRLSSVFRLFRLGQRCIVRLGRGRSGDPAANNMVPIAIAKTEFLDFMGRLLRRCTMPNKDACLSVSS